MAYERQFWMVWNPNGRAPTYCHPSEASAVEEAKRLARLNKGQDFIVLAATHNVVVDPVTVTRLMADSASSPEPCHCGKSPTGYCSDPLDCAVPF